MLIEKINVIRVINRAVWLYEQMLCIMYMN